MASGCRKMPQNYDRNHGKLIQKRVFCSWQISALFWYGFSLNFDTKKVSKLLKMVSTWPLDVARCSKIKTETIANSDRNVFSVLDLFLPYFGMAAVLIWMPRRPQNASRWPQHGLWISQDAPKLRQKPLKIKTETCFLFLTHFCFILVWLLS